MSGFRRCGLVALALLVQAILPPQTHASPSRKFDRACPHYYRQALDPDVPASDARDFCGCIADEVADGSVRALDFYARTYSEDLTAFIHEYRDGEAWMEAFFAADATCKAALGER